LHETRDHWQTVFDGTDACVTPVLGLSEAGTHAQNAARSQELSRGQPMPGAARAVLAEAGISVERIDALVNSGAIDFE
jgi:alpha-methylacyl-CoA racemase